MTKAGIPVRVKGEEKRLTSTKRYHTEEYEKLQLLVERLLDLAHRDGENHWHEPKLFPGLYIGAVWTSQEAEHAALSRSSNSFGMPNDLLGAVLPPAKKGRYEQTGASASNPVLSKFRVWQFQQVLTNLIQTRDKPGELRRFAFYSEDERYPSLIIGSDLPTEGITHLDFQEN